ncbi:MAG: alpha/beta hydrolase [Burkholderiales bacterium]|nr:alpha/beta hydrolase [Burkholderiales bacterium]
MESFVTSDGLKLKYAVDDFTDPWRKAQTLLLVHAAMGSSRRFYAWVPHLARDFRVVRIDLRGHGESEPHGPEDITFERLIQDIRELVDHLELDQVHIAGSSAGAYISQGFTSRHPERVATLGCFAAIAGMGTSNVDYAAWVARIGRDGLGRFLRDTIRDRVDLERAPAGFVDWFVTEAERTSIATLARFVPLMARQDLTQALAAIRCPVLAVAPGGDPLHSAEEYRSLERIIPNCEFVLLEGMPHNITDTVPDRCAQELLRFLKKHAKS